MRVAYFEVVELGCGVEDEIGQTLFMAKKYKISKSSLTEFFGLFGKKKKPEEIQKLIDNDPVLKQLDARLADINKKASERMLKDKPWMATLMKKYGYNPND